MDETEPKRLPVMRGQVLIHDHGTWCQLFCVASVNELKKGGVSAKLLSFEGGTGNVWSSGEYRVHFPDGIQPPFHVVSAGDVVKGKWPERLEDDGA